MSPRSVFASRSAYIVVAVAALVAAPGCGGKAGAGGASSSGGASGVDLPPDPTADAARNYCEHAVAEAVLQPPDALSRKQIQACLTALRPRLNGECGKGAPREIVLKIVVDKSGAVSDAFGVGDGADSPEAACAAEIVKTALFPQFKGTAQQVIEKYPFTLGK